MARARLIVVIAAILCSLLAGPVRGKEEKPRKPRTNAESSDFSADTTSAQVAAVTSGLAWLAAHQNRDGSFGEYTDANVAVTSLSLLALMSDGNTESTGKYCAQLRKGIDFLLRLVTLPENATSAVPVGFIHLPGDQYSKMHAHGYATLALALAYGTNAQQHTDQISAYRRAFRRRLTLAVRLIERAQSKAGGWYYSPIPTGHEGSVTVCEVQALRAARDAGIKVSREVVDKALRYLEESQDQKTGAFCYSLSERDHQTYALTAAALSTLYGLGAYQRSDMVKKGLAYMHSFFAENLHGRSDWFFYGNFYAAQAMFQAASTTWGQRYWQEWWPKMRDFLVNVQSSDGSWSYPRGRGSQSFGASYSTAFSCLILEVPFGYLPIFQR